MRARWTGVGAWARVAAVAAALLVASCADGGDDDNDGDGDDGDDQGEAIDAAADDGVTPDGGGLDGGDTARAAEVCAGVCGAFAECSDQTPDPLCDADCIADLAECSTEEVDALEACAAGECGDLTDCVLAVDCASGSTLP